MERTPGLQNFLGAYAQQHGISKEFVDCSDHPYTCRCDGCKDWWLIIGPDPDDGSYGPFSAEEIDFYRKQKSELDSDGV